MFKGQLHRILGALIFLCSLTAGWLWLDYQSYLDSPMPLPEDGMVYQVAPGSGFGHITRDLAEKGVVKHPLYLRFHGRGSPQARQIHSGEFQLPVGLTPRGLLPLLASGKVVDYPLTVLEGWSFKQVRQAIAAHPVLVQSIAGMSDAEVMTAIGEEGRHPEGRFFPDTYRFPRGTTDIEFLKRAYNRMSAVLSDAWEARAEGIPLKNMEEALILASIVEKETGLAEERAEIAGVFTRRLQKGMRLQTDPTVIYGLGDSFDGNLRRRDLRTDTPYNTYTRSGLPPTPICMPGADAIRAAVNPADGKTLYFVARGDGSHQFSATLSAHNEAVRRYQLKRSK